MFRLCMIKTYVMDSFHEMSIKVKSRSVWEIPGFGVVSGGSHFGNL